MLSHATAYMGRGKGFAVHEMLDQIGAVVGPLVVALILAVSNVNYHAAFSVLVIPGLVAIGVLFMLRRKVPDPSRYDNQKDKTFSLAIHSYRDFPKTYWTYLIFTMLTTAGFATFGVISYHLVTKHVVNAPLVPIIYAATMGAAAVMSLVVGILYDKVGRRSLLLTPVLVGFVPLLAFQQQPLYAISGIILWGFVTGIQESVMRAAVADIIPVAVRGTAYGIFALGFGIASLIGGALAGWLYGTSLIALIITVGALEIVAIVFFIATQRR